MNSDDTTVLAILCGDQLWRISVSEVGGENHSGSILYRSRWLQYESVIKVQLFNTLYKPPGIGNYTNGTDTQSAINS
jgi:hypothetical protein